MRRYSSFADTIADVIDRVEPQELTLAFDPGTTTGVALYLHSDRRLRYTGQMTAVDACQLASVVVDDWYHSVTVVVERFDVGQKFVRSTRNYDAIHVIGYLRLMCEIHLCPFIELGRSDTKTLVDDRKLKALGWYESGRGHSNDALRVLVTRLFDVDPEFRRLVRSELDGTR